MSPLRIGTEAGLDQQETSDDESLLRQAFIRDPSQTVEERVNETVSRVRERIVVRRFARFELGA